MAVNKTNKKDDRRRNRLKTIILLIFSVIMLIIVTIAWFAMNRGATGSGMEVSVADLPFVLKTTGSVAPNEDLIEELGYVDGTEVVGGRTTAGAGQIKWLLQPDDDMVDWGLSPNTSGDLSFTIVPNELDNTKTLNVSYTIQVRAFRLTDEKKAEIAYAIEHDLPEPAVTADDLIELTEANDGSTLNYINGHIFFFSDADNINRVRSGEPQTITANAGSEITVPLHWRWPETLGNLIIPGPDNVCTGDAMDELIDDVQDNPENYFVIENLDSDMYEMVEGEPRITDEVMSDLSSNYLVMSMAYDSADQMIGVNVQYIMIELEATGAIS